MLSLAADPYRPAIKNLNMRDRTMLRFDPNLRWLYTELPMLER
jgi:hypothetical protein